VTGDARPSAEEGAGSVPSGRQAPAVRRPTGAARPVRAGPDLILPVHLVFVALLGVATLVLFAVPTGAGDCCVPVAIFGVITLGELIAVLAGIAVAGVTGRHSPLAIVDAMVTAPLAALIPPAFAATSGPTGAILPLSMGVLVVGLASAILAARVVRERDLERIVLACALVLMAAFSFAVPATIVVPAVVLVALLWPHVEASTDPDASTADEGEGVGPARPTVRAVARRAPDAAAVLARRAPNAAAVLARRQSGTPPPRPPAAPAPGEPPDPA